MSAELIEYFKQDIRNRYVLEVKVWRVDDKRYELKLKYSLIFLEYKTGKRVLMDNHHPKKPHTHIDNEEFDYEFIDVETLMSDFRNLIFKHFGERV
ncbi:MAG: hypothetical protein HRT44_13835 [Bdellovibrionales bacterium]|nr:hypothetical protein [Bdellovibrionales bacterium]